MDVVACMQQPGVSSTADPLVELWLMRDAFGRHHRNDCKFDLEYNMLPGCLANYVFLDHLSVDDGESTIGRQVGPFRCLHQTDRSFNGAPLLCRYPVCDIHRFLNDDRYKEKVRA